MADTFRIGLGFDLHHLAAGRPLILGGVQVPYHAGAVGHSDGDALLHAVTDALLGAVAAGDIGQHFPDRGPRYAGADSGQFVEAAARLVAQAGYAPVNVDATVFLQEPRLGPVKPQMAERIAALLGLEPGAVSIKAKTMEGLGPIGQRKAVAAQAIVLVAAVGASRKRSKSI
jgi:2-C-methyl-D-erythritol 2,4-cyclodiphosphate synthase